MQQFILSAFTDEARPMLDTQIEVMQEHGIRYLEARAVDMQNISDLTLEKAREMKQKMDNAGLAVWSLGSPIGKIPVNDDFAAHMEKLRHTLEVGHILDTKHIRLFSFYMDPDQYDASRSKVIDQLGQMAELCVAEGILPCHENEKGIYGDIPERCVELHEAIPALRAVYDPANFVQCGADPVAAWNMLAKYVEYVHIKDADASGANVPAGTGIGQIPTILEAYAAQGGQVLTLEPHLWAFEGLKALERSGEDGNVQNRAATAKAAFALGVSSLRQLIDNMK